MATADNNLEGTESSVQLSQYKNTHQGDDYIYLGHKKLTPRLRYSHSSVTVVTHEDADEHGKPFY